MVNARATLAAVAVALTLLASAPLALGEAAGDEIVQSNTTTETPPPQFASLSAAQTALREKILRDYDKGSMPPYVPDNDTTRDVNTSEPVTVEVGINFHRVLEVDVVKSEIDLLTWMRFIWTDPRLAWDPEEYNGLDSLWFWVEGGAGMGETSEIWTPDIELWNQKESIKTSYSDSFAAVDPTGEIFWSRPGHLRPVCKFEGLENFPFDNLVCQVELGSWAYSGKFLRPKLFDGSGFSIGGSDTSGEAFSEFRLDNVSAEVIVYPPYPTDPLSDWPVLMYKISFHRSWQPYIRGYLISQIIFNVIGFACFWMPVQSGERLGLAITAMLSAVAADLVVVAKLPSASELTWMQKFSLMSQIFAAYCVLEGVCVSYFYFLTADDLVPSYLRMIFKRIRRSPTLSKSQSAKLRMISNPLQQSDEVELECSPDGEPEESGGMSRRSSFRPRDADDFFDRDEVKANARWKVWAASLDDLSRVLVPAMYAIIVGVFLSEHNFTYN